VNALFVRLYLYIIVALFIGIFFSEYFVNSKNYEEDLLVDHDYAVESIHRHLINELNLASDTDIPGVLDKWEDISGYEIELINSSELVTTIDSILSRTKVKVTSIIEEIQSLPEDDFWVGTDTDFFEDNSLVIARHPTLGRWIAYSEIDARTPKDNEVFIINQLSLLLAFSLALIIFLWPLVNTINALNSALRKFKEGELDITVPVVGPKPLALLNQQFNQMTNELKAKMEEQDLMTSAMSHELKSPITRLRFALDMAIKSDNTEDKNELLSEMDIDLSDLDNLASELLTLAKVASGTKNWQYETINYRALIEQETSRICKYQSAIYIKISGEAKRALGGLQVRISLPIYQIPLN